MDSSEAAPARNRCLHYISTTKSPVLRPQLPQPASRITLLSDTLVGHSRTTLVVHSCTTLLRDTLAGHSCGTYCRKPLWDTLVHSCGTPRTTLTLVSHSCATLLYVTLAGHSCRTLLLDTLVENSCRTLSCPTILWGQGNTSSRMGKSAGNSSRQYWMIRCLHTICSKPANALHTKWQTTSIIKLHKGAKRSSSIHWTPMYG